MPHSRPVSDRRPSTTTLLGEILPSPPLLLRSALLASILFTSVGIAVVAWLLFYASLRTGSLGGRERVWLQYGHYQPPYAHVPLPAGKYASSGGRAYDVALEMTVPAVARNLDLGNFMVTLELRDQTGKPLQKISRPATLLHPKPPSLFSLLLPTRFISKFLFPSSRTAGATTQRLSVPLLEEATLSSRRSKATEAWVQVGREDAHHSLSELMQVGRVESSWGGAGGEVQVYEAWLKFSIRLRGLRYLVQHHPILTFLLFVPLFTLLELLAALIGWAAWLAYSSSRPPSEPTSPITAPSQPPAPGFGPSIKREEVESDSGEEDLAVLTRGISRVPDVFARREREEAEEEEAVRGRAGVGMADVEASGESVTETETEAEAEGSLTEEGGASEGSWEGVEGGVEAGAKDEDMEGTVGGSDTTRGTRSTFGPSLAGTTSTTATFTSRSRPTSSGSQIRARVGRVQEEEEEQLGPEDKGKSRAKQ